MAQARFYFGGSNNRSLHFTALSYVGRAEPEWRLADKRLHRSLDRFNELVRQAHERSLAEHRAYLIVWSDASITLQPAAFLKTEPHDPIDTMPIARHDKWRLEFPAALSKKVPAEWIFWESGVCEPARIRFASNDGSWTTEYSPLSGLGEIISYAAR